MSQGKKVSNKWLSIHFVEMVKLMFDTERAHR